jgi:hypothetical protein
MTTGGKTAGATASASLARHQSASLLCETLQPKNMSINARFPSELVCVILAQS